MKEAWDAMIRKLRRAILRWLFTPEPKRCPKCKSAKVEHATGGISTTFSFTFEARCRARGHEWAERRRDNNWSGWYDPNRNPYDREAGKT